MEVIKIENLNFPLHHVIEPSVICLGFFDGLHVAHRMIMEKTIAYARKHNLRAAILVLDKKASDFMNHETSQIMSNINKQALIGKYGFDYYYELTVNQTLLRTDKNQFVDFLQKKLKVCDIFAGLDYTFGFQKEGNIEVLKTAFGADHVYAQDMMNFLESGQKIGSSTIRQLLAAGQVTRANELLLEPYNVTALVVSGQQLGRTINFPTLNQVFANPLIIPYGTYVTHTLINGQWHPSISCYRLFNGEYLLETHILNFAADLYGQVLRVEFVAWLRNNRQMSDINELRAQLETDKTTVMNDYFNK